VEVQPETRRVVVTTDPDRLLARGLALGDCRWYELPVADEVVEVQVRYRGRRIRCRVELDEGRARVELEEPARALAPGQSAVFYRGDLVLGGGVILGREGAA